MFKIKPIPKSGGMYAVYLGGTLIKGGTKEDVKKFIADTESKPKEFKGKFYCMPHCTECCQQLIKVTEAELFKIRRALRKLGETELLRLKSQERDERFCPLLDTEKGLCSIYESRPSICKSFGCYSGAMCCSYNLDAELEPVEEYFTSLIHEMDQTVGQLGVDYTWEKGLIR